MVFKLKEGRATNPNEKKASMLITLDGYNAPARAPPPRRRPKPIPSADVSCAVLLLC